MRALVTINSRGDVTLPAKLRETLGLKPDDQLIAETTPEGLLLRPAVTLPVEIYSGERVREFDAAEAALARALSRDSSSAARPRAERSPPASGCALRIFLDANILFSAAKSAGAVRRLLVMAAGAGRTLCVDTCVAVEARRNIEAKAPASLKDLDELLGRLELSVYRPFELPPQSAKLLPERDQPVLAAAVGLRCEALVTGDRTHFGALYGQDVRGVRIHSPLSLAEALGQSQSRAEGTVRRARPQGPDRKADDSRLMLVGVDGCREGRWIAVYGEAGASGLRVGTFGSPEEILRAFPSSAVIAVDVPIGLTDSGPRRADQGARELLRAPRASSVFPAPIRAILDCRTREEASQRHREIDGRGFGAQSWAILDRIRDWDRALRECRDRVPEVFEVHPEVSFRALNDGEAVNPGKKTHEGLARRRRLLERHFGGRVVAAVLASEGRGGAADDDVLDALAALWTAGRIARGEARSVPEPPDVDSAGLRMAIWY